jgi:hypothetical protein
VGHDSAAEVKNAAQVDGDCFFQRSIGLFPYRRGRTGDAGVIHQDVNLSCLSQYLGYYFYGKSGWETSAYIAKEPFPRRVATASAS